MAVFVEWTLYSLRSLRLGDSHVVKAFVVVRGFPGSLARLPHPRIARPHTPRGRCQQVHDRLVLHDEEGSSRIGHEAVNESQEAIPIGRWLPLGHRGMSGKHDDGRDVIFDGGVNRWSWSHAV